MTSSSVLCSRGLLSAVLLLLAASVPAQAPEDSKRFIVTGNPLGFLQFGPTVEAERLSQSGTGVAVGLRIPTLGLITHLLDDQIGFAWLGMGSLRIHFDERKPKGWWLGPRAEWGKANSGSSVYVVKGGGLEVGHNRIAASGRVISAGAIIGAFQSQSGLEGKFIMGVLSIGVAR